jgi:hypothetical protein
MIRQVAVTALVAFVSAGSSGCEGLNACENMEEKMASCGIESPGLLSFLTPYRDSHHGECSAVQSCGVSCVFTLSCDELSALAHMRTKTTDPNAVPSGPPPPRVEEAWCCVASCPGRSPSKSILPPFYERCVALMDHGPWTDVPDISQ